VTATQTILWSAAVVLGFIGSALFSGLETGAYRLNRVRLQNLAHQGHPAARTLLRLLRQPTILLSTLLIGNNLMNYLGTAGLTVLFESRGLNEWEMVALNLILVTPLLFVFGETLPKDLFGAHSDRLMYPLAPFLEGSRRLFTILLLVPLIDAVTRAIFRLRGEKRGATAFHPRRQVELLVKEGVGHGLISDEQEAIVERALSISERTVADEMIPWPKVHTLKLSDAPAVIWTLTEKTRRARFPVVDDHGRVTGVLHVMDALRHGRDHCPPIAQLQRPALTLNAKTRLRTALRHLQQSHAALAIVTHSDQPAGIVTIKDLVEPITGELRQW